MPRAVEKDVIILFHELVQLLLQPALVLNEVFHAEEKGSVGSQLHLLHCVLQCYQVFDVWRGNRGTEVAAVGIVLCCWVEVEDDYVSFEGLSHFLHDLAVGGLGRL